MIASCPSVGDEAVWHPDAVGRLTGLLALHQPVFGVTGGIHAALLVDTAERVLCAREDVGRHNAVDKVIGYAVARDLLPLGGHALVVSGRTSFEIVQKAAMAGVGLVAGVSAPTSLAVEVARHCGVILVGFAREGDFNVYGGEERLATVGSGGS
jgi:FdhD protein